MNHSKWAGKNVLRFDTIKLMLTADLWEFATNRRRCSSYHYHLNEIIMPLAGLWGSRLCMDRRVEMKTNGNRCLVLFYCVCPGLQEGNTHNCLRRNWFYFASRGYFIRVFLLYFWNNRFSKVMGIEGLLGKTKHFLWCYFFGGEECSAVDDGRWNMDVL